MKPARAGRYRITALAVLLAASTTVCAQTGPATPAPVCAEASDLTPAHLYGQWQLLLWPEGGHESAPVSSGTLLFERHPEYPGSVRGQIQRSAAGQPLQAIVAGDVLNGEFNLDESADGVNMDAVWSGWPQACGRVIRGTRSPAEGRPAGEPTLHFLLTKTPDWR